MHIDLALVNRVHGALTAVGDARETREVVLADEQPRGLVHTLGVEAVRCPRHEVAIEERAPIGRARMRDAIAITLGDGVADGSKPSGTISAFVTMTSPGSAR